MSQISVILNALNSGSWFSLMFKCLLAYNENVAIQFFSLTADREKVILKNTKIIIPSAFVLIGANTAISTLIFTHFPKLSWRRAK